jgi:hypothetical protein
MLAVTTPTGHASLRASDGLILSARRAGSTQASSPAPSITADVSGMKSDGIDPFAVTNLTGCYER